MYMEYENVSKSKLRYCTRFKMLRVIVLDSTHMTIDKMGRSGRRRRKDVCSTTFQPFYIRVVKFVFFS